MLNLPLRAKSNPLTGAGTKTKVFLILLLASTGITLFGTSGLASAAACPAPAVDYGSVSSVISVPATGTYKLWSRIASGTAATDNSYSLEIDGSTCIVVGDSNTMPTGSWQWVDYRDGNTASIITLANLSAGSHTVKMIGREDGVKLDRIILTQDTTCKPSGTGDDCANPPDAVPPTVSMAQPANNASVSGNTTLQATASDDSGTVSSVSYYIDGGSTAVGSSTTAPYSVTWDTTGVSNGSHTINAKATDPSGNTATSTATTVTVNNSKPDLIVSNLTISPIAPKVGDEVAFTGTIQNIGGAATPNNTQHIITFFVDGQKISYSYSSTASLAAGATRVLTPMDGVNPAHLTWTATAGTHTILAQVDDQNLIAEANETNNTTSMTVTPGATDGTSPITTITSPTSGSALKGASSLAATATDNVAVTKVEFYVDGALKTSDTSSPYSYSWDTTTATNGNHSLTTKAYDAAGNVGTSTAITVSVDNAAPTTSITAPANGSTQTGTINVTANAADTIGVTKVELYVDGNLGSSDVASPYSYSLNTAILTNGPHTLTTKAYDAAGNVTTSAAVSITVNNTGNAKAGDVNGDGAINALDASTLLFNWSKSGLTRAQGDLNGDGVVNALDASILLSNWGK